MTHSGPLRTERRDGVLRLTLDRPDQRNALNSVLIGELRQAIAQADADPDVRVIAIQGAGADFCAGADLTSLAEMAERDVMANLADVDDLAELFVAMRQARRPIVALVTGRALGGGCGLATACDLVYAAESSRFAYSEVLLGFVPAMVMAILRRNVSEKRTFELIATGATLSAAEAERVGLINRVVPDDSFDAEADALLAALAGRSPSALLLSKRLLYLQDGLTFEAAIRAGADVNVLARMTDDTRAGVERFLNRKRPGGGS